MKGSAVFAADECWYIESSRHDSILHTKAGEVTLRSGLSELERQLQPEGFFATHRCYLVNLKAVEQVTREACLLPDHRPVPIARGSYEKVMQAFIAANRS
jgi:DNA-binding LytR/AlgR family response regulator